MIIKKITTAEECEVTIQEKLNGLSQDQKNNIDIFYDVIGLVMKKTRLSRKKTQMKVASWLGVTFQQIQKYENGVNRTPLHSVLIFCEKIKCDISEFTKYFDGVIISTNAKTNAMEITYEQPNA